MSEGARSCTRKHPCSSSIQRGDRRLFTGVTEGPCCVAAVTVQVSTLLYCGLAKLVNCDVHSRDTDCLTGSAFHDATATGATEHPACKRQQQRRRRGSANVIATTRASVPSIPRMCPPRALSVLNSNSLNPSGPQRSDPS